MTSDVVSPAPRDAWSTAIAADPFALPTQSPQWTDAAVATGKFRDASRLYVTPEGRSLVVPMLRRRAGVEGSMPMHWGIGGILAPGGATSDDVQRVLSDLAGRKALRQALRPNPLQAELYRAHRPAKAIVVERHGHVLDLRDGVDAVWKGFSSSRRRGIVLAERAGVEVVSDNNGALLPVHFDLLVKANEQWASQSHEPQWLARLRAGFRDTLPKWQSIARHLDGKCRQWVARVDGDPVASIIVLFGRNAHYTRGAMDRDRAGKVHASELLQWHAMQAACETGAHWYQMGESGRSGPLASYKERFGARPFDYPELRMERLPITRVDTAARTVVKKIVGFQEP